MECKKRRYKAVGFTGSTSPRCDTRVLFVEHKGYVYKLSPQGLGSRLNKEVFADLIDEGYATPLDGVEVEKGALLFYIRDDFMEKLKGYIPKGCQKKSAKVANLVIWHDTERGLKNIRERFCKLLKEDIHRRILNSFYLNDPVDEDYEQIKRLCRYGMFLADLKANETSYLEFASCFGLILTTPPTKPQFTSIALNRLYETSVCVCASKISLEKFRAYIGSLNDTMINNAKRSIALHALNQNKPLADTPVYGKPPVINIEDDPLLYNSSQVFRYGTSRLH